MTELKRSQVCLHNVPNIWHKQGRSKNKDKHCKECFVSGGWVLPLGPAVLPTNYQIMDGWTSV